MDDKQSQYLVTLPARLLFEKNIKAVYSTIILGGCVFEVKLNAYATPKELLPFTSRTELMFIKCAIIPDDIKKSTKKSMQSSKNIDQFVQNYKKKS